MALDQKLRKAGPFPVGTQVRVKPPFSGVEDGLSDITSLVAVQWVTPLGEIVDTPQQDWQYLLDADEPFPDIAVRPEYVEKAE
jgi:hypothetical protein